ncbi:MAG: hypothetical protein Q8R01_13640, partial [Ramlibacter sp.]|nr:hypothetical protein [Ramlibacter sp.]
MSHATLVRQERAAAWVLREGALVEQRKQRHTGKQVALVQCTCCVLVVGSLVHASTRPSCRLLLLQLLLRLMLVRLVLPMWLMMQLPGLVRCWEPLVLRWFRLWHGLLLYLVRLAVVRADLLVRQIWRVLPRLSTRRLWRRLLRWWGRVVRDAMRQLLVGLLRHLRQDRPQ